MALPKLFNRIFWHNNATPALDEDNLNAMSKAIDDIDNRLIQVANSSKAVILLSEYLEAGETSVTFEDPAISEGTIIQYGFSKAGLQYNNVVKNGSDYIVTVDAQPDDVIVYMMLTDY